MKRNQHFVPQSLLKQFSCDQNKKSINLCHGEGADVVYNASIKGQASKTYFYKGPDGAKIYEDELSAMESVFISTLRNSIKKNEIDKKDYLFLCMGVGLQFARTIAKRDAIMNFIDSKIVEEALKSEELIQGISNIIENNSEKISPIDIIKSLHISRNQETHQYFIQNMVMNGVKYSPYLMDLKKVIIKNRTNVPFIIGDNPVVIINQLIGFNKYQNVRSFCQQGIQIFLPFSPYNTLCLFDKNVYSCQSSGDFLDIHEEHDINKLNMAQVINSSNSFYFTNCLPEENRNFLRDVLSQYTIWKKNPENMMVNPLGPGCETNLFKIKDEVIGWSDFEAVRDPVWVKIVDDIGECLKNTKRYFKWFMRVAACHPEINNIGDW